MLDFLMISTKSPKKDELQIYPKFIINPKSSDLMIRGGDFYAVWDETAGKWSTEENSVIKQVDASLREYKKRYLNSDSKVSVEWMWDSDSGSIDRWHKYCQKQMRSNYQQLDNKIIFANSKTKKTDYSSKSLPYPLEEGKCEAWDELISTLYDDSERTKIEWSIGAIISGDAKRIQKFIVFYGEAGSGKSTILNIIQKLFKGYYTIFNAKELASNNNSFALESFKNNPLVAIQHDGDLSKIEDNTKLNSIVSHEEMEINEKFKAKYISRFNAFLYMGTNKPVKITEAKSGLIRRLIDVKPSGRKLPYKKYIELMSQVEFELGAIASHCLSVYNELGESFYDGYIPTDMISATNDFYDFMEDEFDFFDSTPQVTLTEAWRRYRKYCEYANVAYPFNMRTMRSELKNYFKVYEREARVGDVHVRNVYSGFIRDKFISKGGEVSNKTESEESWLIFEESDGTSVFDKMCETCKAQYANAEGKPLSKWANVSTLLRDIDPHKLHYVLMGDIHHIVIDFDLKDKDGNKSFERNLEAARKWPKTYAELSKSGAGIHLHYIYECDVEDLSRIFDEDIEVKVFTGNSSLRRMLTRCNHIPIATLKTGLPLKGDNKKKMLDWKGVQSERQLRTMILRDLNKEYFGYTAVSVDHIKKLLDEAYESGLHYDVSDLSPSVLLFAMTSTHQADKCVKQVGLMKFRSEEPSECVKVEQLKPADTRLVFFDVEVFPNLFLINWKYEGSDTCVRMINPTAADVEELVKKYRLVGFNNRRYDNHILYGRMMGYSNEQLYRLSQLIVNGFHDAYIREAFNLSWADVYDFCSKKQSLKKWEIELGIHHQELGLPWDQPVPEERWVEVAEYCDNDVFATEAVFNARKQDYIAREILADLSGLTVNDTTRTHTTKIIFGDDKHPDLEYTDLSKTFPGYEFVQGEDGKWRNMYRGEDASFGGYVYSKPGMYTNVALLDVESLHPHSIVAMNVFGSYTSRFKDILDARLAIKHHDLDKARGMLDGALAPYLGTEEEADQLQQALKIVINSVYGFTSARFDNPFRDPRNTNNIVALRGALFMMTLRDEVIARGFKVIHIKTDSIKIPNATPEIISFCKDFAKKYQYTFDHEATYSKICLVNDAVYVAKYATAASCENMYGYIPKENAKASKKEKFWTATGTQFQVPYVFKTLFSKDPIVFEDLCETKSVTAGALYLDMNEGMPEDEHNYKFIGRVGQFCPVKEGCGGGVLYRMKDDKYYAATGTKGYRWLESEIVKTLDKEDDIDISYYKAMADAAVDDISTYGDFEWFVSDDDVLLGMNEPEE